LSQWAIGKEAKEQGGNWQRSKIAKGQSSNGKATKQRYKGQQAKYKQHKGGENNPHQEPVIKMKAIL